MSIKKLNFRKQEGLIFGIYPGSGVGADAGSGIIQGKMDEPSKIIAALKELAQGLPFMVRSYIQYNGNPEGSFITPADPSQYCKDNFRLDLALCYRTNESTMTGWHQFIRKIIREYRDVLVKIQITEEPNNPDSTSGGDGSSLNVRRAIAEGVLTAKDEITQLGLDVQIGFNAVISFNPRDDFWPGMAALNGNNFIGELDYIGLDFYPGVFRPLPPGLTMIEAVKSVLNHYRKINLAEGTIPEMVPIHITENGWPTNKVRNEEQQAISIKEIIETVFDLRRELNITHYEFFDLRDTSSEGWNSPAALESSGEGFQFGLMYDDYTPKKAFHVYRNLIEKISS